jgi:hypothetical protein
MSFFHGVRTTETPTSILPPAPCEAAVPVYFGTAPVHRTGGKTNEPVLAEAYDDAVLALGYDDDWRTWTLGENVYSQFALFAMAPAVFVNVFDPAVHKKDVASETVTLTQGVGRTAVGEVILSTLTVKSADGATTYARGTDYSVSYDAAWRASIVRKATGTIPAEATALQVGYSYADPSLVTKSDLIGGIDPVTGKEEGLEAVERVFPKFRLVPGILVASGWSHLPEVAAVLAAKCTGINGIFRAVCFVDIPCDGDGPKQYGAVPEWKNLKNLTDPMQYALWPMIRLGEREYHLSSQMAALTQWVTHWEGKDVPYCSPSNHLLRMDSVIAGEPGARESLLLGLSKANYLNENGVTTALNWIGGWKSWGNRTACFPAVTDPKDCFLPIRLMFDWVESSFILTFWQKVDRPITRRLVETIVDSFNDFLNGLRAQEALLGGRIEFRKQDNPVTDLMSGKLKFKIFLTPPPPAEEISADFEFDPDAFEALFG